MRKAIFSVTIATLLISASMMFAQDRYLAPRSAMLTGTADYPSETGKYFITFPSPNECLTLGPIKADSRLMALYIAVSQGGFSLKPAQGGLTVWTSEEWNEANKTLGHEWLERKEKSCAERSK